MKSSSNELSDDFLDEINLLSALKSKIKYIILLRLLIHNELSLTQLSNKLDRSKSTLHRHIKDLIKKNLVQISKEKKVRGSIKAKYYELTSKFLSNLNVDGGVKKLSLKSLKSNDSNFKEKTKFIRSNIFLIRNILKLFYEYVEMIDTIHREKNKLYHEEFEYLDPNVNIFFLNESQFEEYIILINEFHKKLKNILDQNGNNGDGSKDKSYLISSISLKVEKLLEMLNI